MYLNMLLKLIKLMMITNIVALRKFFKMYRATANSCNIAFFLHKRAYLESITMSV